jgi:hypothetical protein
MATKQPIPEYLYFDTEEISARVYAELDTIFVKHKRQKEYSIEKTTSLATDIMIHGTKISEKQYNDF